jgi:hypothetical protein
MKPELVKFELPTTDQFSVAVDTRPLKRPMRVALADA